MPSEADSHVQSSDAVEQLNSTGFEMFKCLKLFRKPFLLLLVYFFSMINGVFPVINMMVMGNIVSSFSIDPTKTATKAMTPIILTLLYLDIAQALTLLITMLCKSYIIPTFTVDIRQALFQSLMNQPIEYFDRMSSGVLVSRFSEDVTIIRDVYIEKNCGMLQGIIQSILAVIMAFIKLPLISLSYLISIPLLAIIFIVSEKYIANLWKNYNNHSTSIAAKTEEVISQFRTIKAFDGEMREIDEYNKTMDNVDDIHKKTAVSHALKESLTSIIANGLTVVVVYFIAYLMMVKKDSKIKSGDSMSMMMYIMLGTMGLSQIFTASDSYKKAKASAIKILSIVNRKTEIDPSKGKELKDVKGKIEFQDVSFKYSTRYEYALRHLSFSINPGETVALVGESGCGKTTTLSLLQRFYEVTEGKILIDGIDIKDISPISLRKQISSVPQTHVLFSMSISDNIKYGYPSASESDVQKAAEVGNANDFIMELENKYSQEVQQSSMSGGQKQRICISRAVLCNTPILILDEATASLDTESEQLVQQSLENVRKGKTAIVVAHRLATVKNADRILVFQNGQIAESGKHEELLSKDGIYSNLVKYQFQ